MFGIDDIIIGAGVKGLFDLFGSKQSADASTSAAQIQANTAQKALDAAKEVRAQQTANNAPFLAAGHQAAGYLQNLLGQQQNVALPGPYQGNYQSWMNGTAMPKAQTLGAFAQMPQNRPAPGPAMPDGMGTTPGGSTVTLAAPDGSIQQVPAELEQHYLSRGARRVQ